MREFGKSRKLDNVLYDVRASSRTVRGIPTPRDFFLQEKQSCNMHSSKSFLM